MNIDSGSNANDSSGTGGRLDDRKEQDRYSESGSDDDEYHPNNITNSDSESEGTQYDSPDFMALKSHGRSLKLPREQSSGRARVKEMSGEPLKFRKEYQGGKEVTVVDWDEDDEYETEAAGEVFARGVFTPRRYQVKVSRYFVSHLEED